MTRVLKHRLKRSLTAIALAAAISTLGPAANSFFAFSSDFRPLIPNRGGTSIVYENGEIPAWIIAAITRASAPTETALNNEEAPKHG
jgi:hypothetical protein